MIKWGFNKLEFPWIIIQTNIMHILFKATIQESLFRKIIPLQSRCLKRSKWTDCQEEKSRKKYQIELQFLPIDNRIAFSCRVILVSVDSGLWPLFKRATRHCRSTYILRIRPYASKKKRTKPNVVPIDWLKAFDALVNIGARKMQCFNISNGSELGLPVSLRVAIEFLGFSNYG